MSTNVGKLQKSGHGEQGDQGQTVHRSEAIGKTDDKQIFLIKNRTVTKTLL